MHSSRMRTARSLPYRGVSLTDPPGQRPPSGQNPPSGQRPPPPVDRQTPVKLLPCLKLRLWAVTILYALYRFTCEINIDVVWSLSF